MSITLHMVTSLDGYIARKDQDVSWMEPADNTYDQGVELTAEVLATIDAYVMGSHTYELALELGWPYGDTPTVVVTHRSLAATRPSVEFYAGDLPALAERFSQKNMWLVGGAQLCQEFLRLKLVDTLCLTVAPVVLGAGVALFGNSEHQLRLKEVTAFKNGMLDLWYTVERPTSA